MICFDKDGGIMLGVGMGKKVFWNLVFPKGIGINEHLGDVTSQETKVRVIYTISSFFVRGRNKTGDYIKGL